MGDLNDLREDFAYFPHDFSIDPAFDLARVFYYMHHSKNRRGSKGNETRELHPLVHDDRFCVEKKSEECASWPGKPVCDIAKLPPLSTERVFFAVKTCQKFHEERLPVIASTWAKAARHIAYFSEVEDARFGTVRLPGVNNTERGHCGKTEAIVRYFAENSDDRGWDWLVIADDDTMLGVHKLVEHLTCYDPKEVVSLGERYGFAISTGKYGYDYITGGGSMVFSKVIHRVGQK